VEEGRGSRGEDMLRSCALEWTGNWDDYICLVEFAYNNSWHASIKCAPLEMLYGRKCRAPICWDQVGERVIEGPEMIEPDDHVFLKVSHARGVRRFGIKGKLRPRFIGPFEILDCVGEVSYRLALPPQLSHVHNEARTRQKSYADKHHRSLEFQPGDHVFLKVSPARGVRRFGIKASLVLDSSDLSRFLIELVRGYKYHPLHVISYPLDQIRTDLSYVEEPEAILDRQDRVMRKKTIPFVKILWRNHPEREATWETEESIRTSYPRFLP
nr:hypothetical protein [Tanacetum cinerariifolium]